MKSGDTMNKPTIRKELDRINVNLQPGTVELFRNLLKTPVKQLNGLCKCFKTVKQKHGLLEHSTADPEWDAQFIIIPAASEEEPHHLELRLINPKTLEATKPFDLKADTLLDDYIWCEPGIVLTLGVDKK